MERVVGLAIAIALLVLSSFIGDGIHDYLYQRSKPAAISTPEKAPYPLQSFSPADVKETKVDDAPGGDQWSYSWHMATSSGLHDIVPFYKLLYPQGMEVTDHDANFSFVPSGAPSTDKATIKVHEGNPPTTIDITELKTKDSHVVPAGLLKFFIFIGMLLVLLLARGGLKPLAGRFMTSLATVRVATRYERLPSAPGQIVIKWAEKERALELLGFQPGFDYHIASVDFPNATRLFHIDMRTMAMLQHAVVNDVTYEWTDMATYFDDGTSVTTTTSSMAGGTPRPERFPIVTVPENTSAHILFDAHTANVARHQTGTRGVLKVDFNTIFALWNRIEASIQEAEATAPAPSETPAPAASPILAPDGSAMAPDVDVSPTPSKPVDNDEVRTAFRDRIMEKIRQNYPDLQVRAKDILAIVIDKPDGGIVDLDVTTVFYMYRNNPDGGDGIIDRFVGQVKGRILEYRAPGAAEPLIRMLEPLMTARVIPLLDVPGAVNVIEIPSEPFTRAMTLERRTTARKSVQRATQLARGNINSMVWRDALTCLSEAATLDPGFYEPQVHLGFAYTAMGQWKLAESYLSTARKLDPTVGGSSSLAWQITETMAGLAEMRSDPAGAITAYQRFLECFPFAPEAAQVVLRLGLLDLCGSHWGESLKEGCAAALAGNTDGAIQHLNAALKYYPGAGFLHRFLGLMHQTAGHPELALPCFEAALDLNPHSLLLVDIGLCHQALKNPRAEEESYRGALKLNPFDAAASYRLGRLLHANRARGEALACLRRAVYLDPEAPWTSDAWALLDDLLQVHRAPLPRFLTPTIAWKQWTDWVYGIALPYPETAPVSEPGRGLLLRVGSPGDLAFTLELARHRLLDDETFGPWRRAVARAQRVPGWQVEEQKARSIPGALGHYFRLQQARTEDVQLRLLLLRGRDLFELVVCAAAGIWLQSSQDIVHILARADMLAAARLLEGIQQRVKQDPNNLDALAELGAAFLGIDDLEHAEEAFQRVLVRQGDHPLARTGLGRLYWKQKKPDAVLKTLEQTSIPEPYTDEAFILLGRASDARKQHEQAVKYFRRALDVTSDPMVVLLLLAASFEATRQSALAEEHYAKALEKAADPCYVRLLMAAFYRRHKSWPEALASAREASTLDAEEMQAHLLQAFCHMDMRQWNEAQLALSTAATLQPDHAGLKAARQELEARARRR